MSNYTLIIVDFQLDYDFARTPALVKAGKSWIERARSDGAPIVSVTTPSVPELERRRRRFDVGLYDSDEVSGNRLPTYRQELVNPRLHHDLLRALVGYDKCAFREKLSWNGALTVVYAMHERGFPQQHLRFMGGSGCLVGTVRTMRELRPYSRLEVLQDASCLDEKHPYRWDFFHEYNVELNPGVRAA